MLPMLALLLLPQSSASDFDALLRRHAASGWSGSVLVARAGEPVFVGGYGFADLEAGRANDGDTLFEVASLTKSFTAVAVVRLAQLEKLALDDALAVHVPGVPAHSRAITLRHLLSHTSGIPRMNARGSGEELTHAMLDYLGDGPQRDPGARFEYWNGGYALLAGVIEHASGKSYTEFLEAELLTPAGMSASGFTGDANLASERLAVGQAREGRDRRADEHPYGAYDFRYKGMGGLVTSARELFAFDRALAAGLLLDSEHLEELSTPVRDGYALGWWIGRSADGSPRWSHGGSVRGFTCEFRRYPEQDGCVAVLCNTDDVKPWEVADGLEQLLLGRGKPGKNEPGLLPPEEEAACAGTYACSAGRIVVRAAPGVLWAGIEGAELLARLGADEKLAWKADPAELTLRAVAIIDGIAHGDTELLRTSMARRIPASWPDTMRASIWPAVLARHGPFRGAFPLGARALADRLEVLVAVEHEQRTNRALVAFSPAGLELLDWNGPTFLADGRLARLRRGTFELTLGGDPRRFEFTLEKGTATELRLGSLELVRE
jgi:CubicO group peptidase (beta-lactamase class C family)